MPPLVTCIMPTANRRAMLPRAIELFLAQDYPRKQLLIVEDGAEHNVDLVLDLFSQRDLPIEYRHLGDDQKNIGQKRNIACDIADGELIAHFDDDDWHSPRRLSAQVAALKAANARICGMDRSVFYRAGATTAEDKAYLYQAFTSAARRVWLAGNTLLYEKSLWVEIGGFTQVQHGEDTAFVDAAMRAKAPHAVVQELGLFVTVLHASNTSPYPLDVQWSGFDVNTIRGWMR